MQVVWESRFGTSFVLGAPAARNGTWKELARIDWMRGTVKDSDLSSRNCRGNVVEACVGASFLAAHELAASGATTPRLHFRTEPPEALAQVAAIFPFFVHLGVSPPDW